MQLQPPPKNCTFNSFPFAAGNLQHLQAELARIDILIQREVRRWQLAGQDTSDVFRGLYVSDEQANALLERPAFLSWGQTVSLPADEEENWRQALFLAENRARELADAARARGEPSCLEHLVAVFGLDRFDIDALLICLAPTLDLRYERLYGYLQDDVTRKHPSVNLVLNLLSEPGLERIKMMERFASSAPLLKYRILDRAGSPPLLGQTLAVDESVAAWLRGSYQPGDDLRACAVLQTIEREPADALLAGETWAEFDGLRDDLLAYQGMILALYGPDRASREALSRLIASRFGKPLFKVDLSVAAHGDIPLNHIIRLALRDARLTGGMPVLEGWDVCLEDGIPPAELLAEMCSFPGVVIVSGAGTWLPAHMPPRGHLLWLEHPLPGFEQRRSLWNHYLEGLPAEEALDVVGLAGQFILSGGQIRDAAAAGRDLALHAGRPLRSADLFAAARQHSNPRLSSLARKIQPRYDWQDIILPPDQMALLREIIATVRGQAQVLEVWGLGRKLVASSGVTVLFAGPPGTGKTMAAEVIAGELGLDLYKIDLSMVVSKYIGETEKNLEHIFHEAEASNAILFFDEADALFGKRSEVRDSHDRYANIEISYLLQRMEAYDGVTILATNLRANLDDAFTRRLQFAVEFPFPEEADRLLIWQTLFPPGLPRGEDIDLSLLARRFKLAGGSIRNILASAAYLAASDGGMVTMAHLLHGTRRELQKMGRLVEEEKL